MFVHDFEGVSHFDDREEPPIRCQIEVSVCSDRRGTVLAGATEALAIEEFAFDRIDGGRLHSVSLGAFRLTRDHFHRVTRLYPDEPLFAQNLQLNNGIISYPLEREREMIEFCEAQLMKHIPAQSYRPCEWHD